MSSDSLRSRQTALARDAILDAAVDALIHGSGGPVALREVAERAGVSLRTLYRYFPSRQDLLEAAAGRVLDELHIPPFFDRADGIPKYFLEASAPFADQLELVRTLMTTSTGRAARDLRRAEFLSAITKTLGPALEGRTDMEQRQVVAVIFSLARLATWFIMCDQLGLSPDDARHAAAWAIAVLIAEAQRGGGPLDVPGSAPTP